MPLPHRRLLAAGQIFFLAAVALLIVRNNSLPWPLKRSSDILFGLSLVAALIFTLSERRSGVWPNVFRRARWGWGLIAIGLIVAGTWGYFGHGLVLTDGGRLNILRFGEDFAIFMLAGFFQLNSSGFVKKVALAQLTTLVYVYGILGGNSWIIQNQMDRFSFLENWPSTVSYNLLVSLAILITFLVLRYRPNIRFWLIYIFAAALGGIMLWTQSRAAWLGTALMAVLALYVYRRFFAASVLRLFGRAVLLIGLFVLGFLFIPRIAQNLVILRVFPELKSSVSFMRGNPSQLVGLIAENKTAPVLSESSRPYLWRDYAGQAIKEPLGLGVSYFPSRAFDYDGVPREPHNILLETWALGGILALAGWLLILAQSVKNAWRLLSAQAVRLWAFYMLLALIGLATAFLFDNMVNFRLFWVIAGLSVCLTAAGADNPDESQ